MRGLLVVLGLFTAQAFACPNLTGSYTCNYQDGSSEVVTVSQDQKDGVTVYNYNGSEMPADNQTYQIPDDENLKQGTWRAWCDAGSEVLAAQILGKYYNQGSYAGDLTMNIAISLNGGNLQQVTNGQLVNSGGSHPFSETMVCNRN